MASSVRQIIVQCLLPHLSRGRKGADNVRSGAKRLASVAERDKYFTVLRTEIMELRTTSKTFATTSSQLTLSPLPTS